ncbi:MAG TPA: hypothetical protein VFL91_07985 [Thermomicrobiales bacterium]|nr:hypothetical protein [Thermomicrobiales bacterium]
MTLFTGLDATDYQDVLRGTGRLIDGWGLRSLRLIEHGDSIVIQGRPAADPHGRFVTMVVGDDAIQGMLREAYRQRGPARAAPWRAGRPSIMHTTARVPVRFPLLAQTGYQPVLRAIGRLMDAEQLRGFRIVEQADGLVLQARRHHFWLRGYETFLLPEDDVRALLRGAAPPSRAAEPA